MLKSEMQHQFWITKKTVQRKLGSKEDEHILSSDAELDAKIEVFKSILCSSADLAKIIDQYQERLCILSQEECLFGRFLKEVGKRSKTTGQSITNTGKAVSYSGQQRMCVRVPLLRLQHEVQVFRYRAVRDTQATIQSMEKERTEYRAALCWMKSASAELDPDTGKGLDKFRTAQTHVRAAKQNFDSLSLDSVQKIDLLAAARCNMYSHALVAYMNELQQFAEKTANTFDIIAKSLLQPKFAFSILKELTQHEGAAAADECADIKDITTVDKDQTLFFADDYADEQQKQSVVSNEDASMSEESTAKFLIELDQLIEQEPTMLLPTTDASTTSQQETSGFWSKMLNNLQSNDGATLTPKTMNKTAAMAPVLPTLKLQKDAAPLQAAKSSKPNPWMDLFADLDPFAHPDAFDLKLNSGRTNSQQT